MLRRAVWVLLVLALAFGAACANGSNPTSNPSNSSNSSNPSNPTQRPSCLPPGYRPRAAGEAKPLSEMEDREQELDVMLAVVEGDVITKRRLARELGGMTPGVEQGMFNQQIHTALKKRAQLLLFVKESQRVGLMVRDSILDTVVENKLAEFTASAAETIGRPVTVDEYLEDKGLTMEEFRLQWKERLQQELYIIRLREGLGGPTRPMVDMEVSPAEVRRIYWNHPGAFDERAGVRFSMFSLLVDDFLTEDGSFLDAEEDMIETAEKVEQALGQGLPAARIAEQFEMAEGQWRVPKEDDFALEGGPVMSLGDEVNAWLFDPVRKAGDAMTVPGPGGGYVVLGFVESRVGRRVPYEEAYPAIVGKIQDVRTHRLMTEKLVEILSTRNAVLPASLAAEMLHDARQEIRRIDQDPIAASAKFR